MKQFILLILSVLLFSYKTHEVKYADLTFLDNRIYNIGEISRDTIITKRINFINKSNNTLDISKIYKSCSCTDVLLSNNKILPLKKGYVDIEIDTKNKIGEQEIIVHLIANTEIKDHVIRIIFEIN